MVTILNHRASRVVLVDGLLFLPAITNKQGQVTEPSRTEVTEDQAEAILAHKPSLLTFTGQKERRALEFKDSEHSEIAEEALAKLKARARDADATARRDAVATPSVGNGPQDEDRAAEAEARAREANARADEAEARTREAQAQAAEAEARAKTAMADARAKDAATQTEDDPAKADAPNGKKSGNGKK